MNYVSFRGLRLRAALSILDVSVFVKNNFFEKEFIKTKEILTSAYGLSKKCLS